MQRMSPSTAAEVLLGLVLALSGLAGLDLPLRLQVLDAQTMNWRQLRVRTDPGCLEGAIQS